MLRLVSALSYATGIKIELLDRTFEMPLLQVHPVIFGQHTCYINKKRVLLILLKKRKESFKLLAKYS